MRARWLAALVAATLLGTGTPVLAAPDDASLYRVSEISVVPDAMRHGDSVRQLYRRLLDGLRKQPGLLHAEVTQQLGQPYNFTLIEQWRDRAALDAASNSEANREFERRLDPLLSGPVYQRVFRKFE